MKLVLALILSVLSLPALAQFEEQAEPVPQVLFSGITEEGAVCEVSIETQMEGTDFIIVNLKVGQDEFYFVNEMLDEKGRISETVSGLFQYDNGRFQLIIGAPIFAMGGYTEMAFRPNYNHVGQIEGIVGLKVDKFAVVGFVETGRKNFSCNLP